MTPLQIQMMLHYYAIARPYAVSDPDHARSPAVLAQRCELMSRGLIAEVLAEPSGFQVTNKGRAYIDALLAVRDPVCKWVQPEAGQ